MEQQDPVDCQLNLEVGFFIERFFQTSQWSASAGDACISGSRIFLKGQTAPKAPREATRVKGIQKLAVVISVHPQARSVLI